jgi:hypothetical protein
MYRLVYYSCCLFSLGSFGLFLRMVLGGYWYAAIASILITLLIILPVLQFHFKPGKTAFIPLKWSAVHPSLKFRWVRKSTAAMCCIFVIGSIQHRLYEDGIAIAGICAIFLLPLDKLLFGPASKYPLPRPWKSIRFIFIVGGRNYGIILYTFHLSQYLNRIEPKIAITGMIGGLLLLFMRPIILLVAPQMPPKIASPAPATATVAPLVTQEPVKKTEPKPAPLPEQEEKPPQPDLPALKEAYFALQQLPAHTRGFAFQRFLHDLFSAHHLITRTAFRLTGEEIDGSFDLGSHTWLLEAKWHSKPTAQSDLLVFNSKVEGKSTWARGIFISYAGFTYEGLIAFRHGKRTSIIGMDGNDLLLILDGAISLQDAIKIKSMKAVENNDFFVTLSALI